MTLRWRVVVVCVVGLALPSSAYHWVYPDVKPGEWFKEKVHIDIGTDKCPTKEPCGDCHFPPPKLKEDSPVTFTVMTQDISQPICLAVIPRGAAEWRTFAWKFVCAVHQVSVCAESLSDIKKIRVLCDDSRPDGMCHSAPGNLSTTPIKFRLKYDVTDGCPPYPCEDFTPDFTAVCSLPSIGHLCHVSDGVRDVCRATCASYGVPYPHCSYGPSLCANDVASPWATLCRVATKEACAEPEVRRVCFHECSRLGVQSASCSFRPCDDVIARLEGTDSRRPRCESDGTFAGLQCDDAKPAPYCWCVDAAGHVTGPAEEAKHGKWKCK